jgi:hypothetical protein
MTYIHRRPVAGIVFCSSLLATSPVMTGLPADAREAVNLAPFACGGSVEQRLWALWDGGARDAVRTQLIEKRLLRTGDTYALYVLQTTLGNLVAMADRCGRHSRLVQLADLLLPVFKGLETLPPPHEHQQGWVCRGGSLCTKANRRLGREVPLVSLQGLGLFTDLAARLHAQSDSTLQRHPFVRLTASAAQGHLERMATPALRDSLRRRLRAKPEDVTGNSSELLFTSFDIWRYTIAINTAAFSSQSWRPSPAVRAVVHDTAQLFAQRTVIDRTTSSPRASLDAGFWDHRVDHAYAGYEGSVSPVQCVKHNGQLRPVPRNPPISPQPVANMGWDISHARRLVPLFDAVERHRLKTLLRYGLPAGSLPSAEVRAAYANQLVDVIWNQDQQRPLFTNYWSGANGWYRVAYNPGNGDCRTGAPPYGLTSAFAQGGFLTWGGTHEILRKLGERIYRLSLSTVSIDQAWMKTYYPQLTASEAAPGFRQLGKIQFLASLISRGQQPAMQTHSQRLP